MLLSYRYRIYPNKAQEDALSQMLGDFCQLYNAALEHRINTFRHGVSIRCYDQINTLPEIRRDLEHQRRWSYTAQQQLLRQLDKAYSAFFGRIKKGIKAGFPRFKPRDRYSAADFRVGDGLTLKKSGKIGFIGVPNEVKVKWHRALPSKPKSAILCRNAGQWHIIFHVEIAATERSSTDSIGVDLGLTALMALSNGEKIARPNFTKRSAAKLRRAQRALARCKRGSNIRKKRKLALAKFQSGIANSRKHFLHQESRKLVSRSLIERILTQIDTSKPSTSKVWRAVCLPSMLTMPHGMFSLRWFDTKLKTLVLNVSLLTHEALLKAALDVGLSPRRRSLSENTAVIAA